MNLYKFTFKTECFQTDLLPQAEQSLQEKIVAPSILVLDIIRAVSRLKTVFFLKILKMNQTEVAPDMKAFCIMSHALKNTTLILKRPQRRNTHSFHKHN